MSDLLTAALELASRGTRVFPTNADKTPRTKTGFKEATTNADTIRAWNWNSDAMIGAVLDPGMIVVDIDPRNQGKETQNALRRMGRTFSATRVVRTAGEGFHYYYRVPADKTFRSGLGPGIDIKRPDKGYIIVPPSEGYRVVAEEVQDAPQWLVDELEVQESETKQGEASSPKFFEWEDGTAYGLKAMEKELELLESAPNGERNNTLNKSAFSLAQLVEGGELRHDKAEDNLLRVAEHIGLSPAEARQTIRSGWKAGSETPRQAPAEPKMEPQPMTISEDAPNVMERNWLDWTVEHPPPPYILDPIIPENAYVLVYGPTEASKSMVFVGMGAEGSRRQKRFSIYSLENPFTIDRDRLQRFKPDPAYFRLTQDPLDFNDPRQFTALIESEREWKPDVVVVDTYSFAFSSRSEDGNAKAIAFAQRVRHLMHELGCSVVLLDHTGYEGDEPRDASAKRQVVDVAILMKKRGTWEPGNPARFMMDNKKPARFGNPFVLNGEIVDVNDGHRGLEIRWEGKGPTWA